MKNTDEALSKLIEKGIEAAEKTGQFVIEQAPELIQQFYAWHTYKSIFGIIIGLVFIFLSYKAVLWLGDDEENYMHDAKIFKKHIGFGTILTSTFILLFGIAFLIINIYELLFIITAPKLYLIEYFVK